MNFFQIFEFGHLNVSMKNVYENVAHAPLYFGVHVVDDYSEIILYISPFHSPSFSLSFTQYNSDGTPFCCYLI